MHCMWKCESWTLDASKGSLLVRRLGVKGQSRSRSRGSSALDDVTEGFSSLSLFACIFSTQSVICPWLDETMANHLPGSSSDPHSPAASWVRDRGELEKSVWQTSWRRYRSTARWTGRAEASEWRRLYTIFTAGGPAVVDLVFD